MELCGCGKTKGVASSHKALVILFIQRNKMEIARTFMYFYAHISGKSFNQGEVSPLLESCLHP